MKRTLLTLILSSTALSLTSGQTQNSFFLIGAEWLNYPGNTVTSATPTSADWTNIQDLGLNWGMISITGADSIGRSKTRLNDAGNRSIHLNLSLGSLFSNAASGRRWQYHPEYRPNMDTSGRVGGVVDDLAQGASKLPEDSSDQYSAWRGRAGIDPAGYMISGIRRDTNEFEPDGYTYYLKVRARLFDEAIPPDTTRVLRVDLVDSSGTTIKRDTIRVGDFRTAGYRTYLEIPAFSFDKNQNGDTVKQYPPRLDQIGLASVQDFAQAVDKSDWQYKVYWFGNVTCYLDYLIVDDVQGNETFTGVDDAALGFQVEAVKADSGLGRFKIADEPPPSMFLSVGYVERIIRGHLSGTSQTFKTGVHFDVAPSYYTSAKGPQFVPRYIQWTQCAQNLWDQYPICAALLMPGQSNYESAVQDTFQHALVVNLQTLAQYSQYYSNLPLWFTPQLHNYIKDDGTQVLREPTTYEIRSMVNLGLTYGAKGIHYFPYYSLRGTGTSQFQILGLADVDGSIRSADKWAMVKSINAKLKALGPTLISLTWQGAKSWIASPQQTSGWTGLVTDVATKNLSGTSDAITYIETGHFTSGGTDYIFVTNRRTQSTDTRNVRLYFNGNRTVTRVSTDSSWFVASGGSFVDQIAPGDGVLYKVETLNITGTYAYVPSGKEYFISPGNTFRFGSNSSLYVTGKLTAIGTGSEPIVLKTSNGSTYWSGVNFYGAGASNSTIAYFEIDTCSSYPIQVYGATNVTIAYGTINGLSNTPSGILFSSSATGTVSACTIQNCGSGNGVFITGSATPTISSCTIQNNRYDGVLVSSSYSAPTITGCTIINNGQLGGTRYNYGVDVYDALAVVRQNTIQGSLYGIVASDNGTAYGYQTNEQGCNTVTGNSYGLLAYNIGDLEFGEGAAGKAAYNTFGTNDGYEAIAGINSTILAMENYWGQFTPRCYAYGNSTIWSDYPLTSPPTGCGSGNRSMIAGNTASTDKLLQAKRALGSGDYSSAQSLLQGILSDTAATNTHRQALVDLFWLYCRTKDKAVRNYIVNTASQFAGLDTLAEELAMNMATASGELDNAVQLAGTLRKQYPGTDVEMRALVHLASLRFFDDSRKNVSYSAYALLASLYGDKVNTGLLAALKPPVATQAGSALGKVSGSSTGTGYSVSSYPNPFNPTTKVHYTIPEGGRVSIIVYDVIGRQVAILAQGYYDKGEYTVQWDGRNQGGSPTASGIYFIRLQAGGLGAPIYSTTIKILMMK